jgi:hypothetical protein
MLMHILELEVERNLQQCHQIVALIEELPFGVNQPLMFMHIGYS